MKIITSYPIYLDNEQLYNDMYLNLDAKSPSNEIMDFQRYAISKGYDLSYIRKTDNKKVNGVDGIFGTRTSSAYSKIGKEWEKTRQTIPTEDKTTITSTTTDKISATEDKATDEQLKRKKLINTLLIVGAGVIVLGIFIFLARKRTNITNKRVYVRRKYV